MSVNFNPRAPYGARQIQVDRLPVDQADFNPRAPYGARPYMTCLKMPWLRFQSTRPIRGATTARKADIRPLSFQSTRPIRGATAGAGIGPAAQDAISIHAPHTGRDSLNFLSISKVCEFQSTRPIRGATCKGGGATVHGGYFNPRAPYGARLIYIVEVMLVIAISIHAPHTGRDHHWARCPHSGCYFNPRAPYGARRSDSSEP